jgi:pSer/pThr/pTyr-binding forkhead associated (FHA) protein
MPGRAACGRIFVEKEGRSMNGQITLTIKNGKFAGKKYELGARRRYLIGRAACCEVQLPAEREFFPISRRHCLLDVDPPTIRVRDCGSRYGTYVNGMQIGRPASWCCPPEIEYLPFQAYDLKEGDELRVGDTLFQVGIHEP